MAVAIAYMALGLAPDLLALRVGLWVLDGGFCSDGASRALDWVLVSAFDAHQLLPRTYLRALRLPSRRRGSASSWRWRLRRHLRLQRGCSKRTAHCLCFRLLRLSSRMQSYVVVHESLSLCVHIRKLRGSDKSNHWRLIPASSASMRERFASCEATLNRPWRSLIRLSRSRSLSAKAVILPP